MKPKATLGFYLAIAHFFLMAGAFAMPTHTTSEIIVKYKEASMKDILSNKGSASTSAFILRLSYAKKLKLHKSFPNFNIYSFEVPMDKNVDEMMDELKGDSNVEFSEPNYVIKADRFSLTAFALESLITTNDSVGVFELKPQTMADPIVVGVVDTGIDTAHPALQNRIWTNAQEIPANGIDDDGNGYIDDIQGWNFANGTNNAFDDNGHGTHVSGIISGVSLSDTTGNFKLVPLKFLDSEGMGTTLDAISAISYGLQIGVKVFNTSWGGGGFSMALHDVVTQTYKKGVLMVAAAGNESQDIEISPTYPASFEHPNLISVAATTSLATNSGSLAWFSNYGSMSVDLGAPGVSIYSTLPGGKYGAMSGTSMATPYITRVAMLMMDQNRSLSVFQIKKIMMETVTAASSLSEIIVSAGIVNMTQALATSKLAKPDGVMPAYTPSFLSLLSPEETQKEVSMGPSGCGWIDSDGPSNWDGGSMISLILVIFVLGLIQIPARLQLHLTDTNGMNN